HDAEKPFVVEAGELMIEDVGTSFNVSAYPQSQLIVITVESGEVKVFTRNQEGLNLIAGEAVSYDTKTHGFNELAADRNAASYKDKVFIFKNTSLEVIVKLLNDVYEKDIRVEKEDLKKCRLTASFRNETFDSILDVIAETLHLQIRKSQNQIFLEGNGCR